MDGFVDLLYLGGLLSGPVGPVEFSVDVEYSDIGLSGFQRFELYVSAPFTVVVSGETQQSFVVLEPSTVALVACGLGWGLLGRLRMRQVKR